MSDPILASFLGNIVNGQNYSPKGKSAIKLPSSRRQHISLSDIIAATIGEEARFSDNVAQSEHTDNFNFDFLQSAYELNEEHSKINEHYSSVQDGVSISNETKNNSFGTIETDKIGEYSSNACDSFSKQNANDNNPDSKLDFSFNLAANIGFESELDISTPPKLREYKSQQKSYTDNTNSSKLNDSYDSDLEDSINFVDPNDLCETKVAIETEEHFPEPPAKKLKILPPDGNSCPVESYDCNPEFLSLINSDTGNSNHRDFKIPENNDLGFRKRSRSISGNVRPGLTRQKAKYHLNQNSNSCRPRLQRARSFTDACHKEEWFPFDDLGFSTPLASLLETPENLSITKNPIFSELKSTLLSDCQTNRCPQTLFDTLATGPSQDVYSRERSLQAKFSNMQVRYPDEVREMSEFYHQQSAEVETERLKEIHCENTPKSYRNYLNSYYDSQLHMIMDRVEKSLSLLSTAKKDVVAGRRVLKARPLLSRKAVAMMDEWFSRNYEHPYPSNTAVEALAKAGEINSEQVKKWFANKRNRSKNTKSVTEVHNMKRKRQFSARW